MTTIFFFIHKIIDLQVKDSSVYLAVASNISGSMPKDLFEDVMEELEKQVGL